MSMDPSFLQGLFDQGGAFILAGVMIYILKSWYDLSLKRADEQAEVVRQSHELEVQRLNQVAEDHKAEKGILASIVQGNTESNLKLIAVVERIERYVQAKQT